MLGKIIRWFTRILVAFVIFSFLLTLVYRFVPVPFTWLMIQRYTEASEGDKERDIKKDWVSISEMSSNLPKAMIAAEDANFEDHFGFDIDAIEKARVYNEKHQGKKVRGASTISQQTAKNVFLWPNRSWLRKGLEVYFTFLIELVWSKKRIMEVYLNVIEMGPGVYGAEAASRYYFNKPASKLSQKEAALIAAILPNPRRWSASRPTAYILRRSSRIVKRMNQVDLSGIGLKP